jgi:DHA3 family macrolide efflux protein-like MFS transporter
VLLIAFTGLAVLTVPLAGGRLTKLADLRFRRFWALFAALVIQVVIISVLPEGSPALHSWAHMASYVLAGYFVLANWRVPGIWLIGLGGAANLAAIAANDGIMPASASALAAAGRSVNPGEFTNSGVVADPNLAFLGDIFAIPEGWPLHNVFSIGDLCIALGAIIALHRLCESRLFPSGKGQFAALRSHPGFMRAWGAQAVSNMGDWVYALAVAASLARRGGSPHHFSLLLIAQVGPAAVAGVLVGPLIDRFSRKRLMIGADVLRGMAVGSLLFADQPSLPHLYGVAALLGLLGAVFRPSLGASLPNLVPKEQLVAANALMEATYNFAVMAGPVVGGLLVAQLGAKPAFAVNSLTFMVSALFLSRLRLPRRAPSASARQPLRALAEGIRYAARSPLVRVALFVIGLVMFASTIRTPLEPIFVVDTLGGGPASLGMIGGAWGLGMLLGSVAAPAAARRWALERLLGIMIAVLGTVVLIASRASDVPPVLLLWVFSGMANGIGSVAFETLLQERVPDAFRGRIMAATESVMNGAAVLGLVLSGAVASIFGIRGAFALSGGVLMITALLCLAFLGRIPGRHRIGRRVAFASPNGARPIGNGERSLAPSRTNR